MLGLNSTIATKKKTNQQKSRTNNTKKKTGAGVKGLRENQIIPVIVKVN